MLLNFLKHKIPIFSNKKGAFVVFLFLLLLGNILIFEDYLLGNSCFVFEDWGGDSVLQFFPRMYYLTNVHKFGNYWVHESGLGRSIFMIPWVNIFNPVLHLVGRNTTISEFAHRFIYYACIQSVLAGISFFWYLRRSGCSPYTSTAGSLSYALCGAYTAISTWNVVLGANLLAALAISLYAHKAWQENGRWYLFTLAIAYFGITTQPVVTLYQVTVFFVLYLLFDAFLISNPFSLKNLQRFLLTCIKTAVVGGLGILLIAFYLFPHMYYMLCENPRTGSYHLPFYVLPHAKALLAFFLRLFSNDLVGTANVWTAKYAYRDYFELPFLYCGLLFLITIPLYYISIFKRKSERSQLVAMSILLLPLILSQIFPGLREYMFYAGKFSYFRWSSIFVTAGIAIVGSKSIEFLIRSLRTGALNRITLSGISFFLLGGLAVCFFLSLTLFKIKLDPMILVVIVATLINYTIVLYFRNPHLIICGLLIIVFTELVIQGHRTVSYHRRPLIKNEFKGKRHFSSVYSNQSVLKALEYIKQHEQHKFYRISKTPEYEDSVDSSSLCQRYFGTRSYTTIGNRFTVEFYNRQLERSSPTYFPGFIDRYYLDSLVGVKYYVNRSKLPIPPWAEKIKKFGKVEVYRNPRTFPLGVIYRDYMLQKEFDALDLAEEEKDQLLMLAAILPEDQVNGGVRGLQGLRHLKGPVHIPETDESLLTAIQQRQKSGFRITSFENDVITGRIKTDTEGILFFSIPFDPGWHIFMDGSETEKIRVQIGFLGCLVPAGSHAIRLKYVSPYFRTGQIVSIAALVWLIITISLFRCRAAHVLKIPSTTFLSLTKARTPVCPESSE